jgi:mono/diheme cytochrome c family protein
MMLKKLLPASAALCLAAHAQAATLPAPYSGFLEARCFDCHDSETKKGGLDLAALSFDLDSPETFSKWAKVHDLVRDGEMPPKNKKRPPREETEALLAFLDARLHEASAARQAAEGRAMARRLNRDEIQNTLRDLLGVLEDYRPLLPTDDRAHGFDKAAAALNLSAAHLEAYLAVADAALGEVFAPGAKPPVTRQRHPQRWSVELSGESMAEKHRKFYRDLPDALVRFGDLEDHLVGFRGAPAPGWYRFRVRARAFQSEQPVKARIRAGFKFGRTIPRTVTYTEFPAEGGEVEVTVYLSKGETLRVAPIGIAGPGTDHRVPFGGGLTGEKYTGPGLAMEWVEAEGPLWDEWPRHRRVLGELNLASATRADAERVLRGFLPRAFRRPVAEAEVAHYLGLFDGARAESDFLTALKFSLKAALCSPHFIYLQAPAGPLDDHALAARLSYFLWSSMPDEELRALAGRGALREPGTLRAQVERMLADPKAAAFTEGFAGQWLDLRKIDFTTPDERLYPEWDELLQWSAVEETRRFFDTVLKGDLSVTHFIQSDFAILNDRLARHYGIPGVEGVALRKVALPPGSPRGGVLAQAAVLKVTADGTVTSPVLRGVWVLERILGQPVPPPPSNVPAIEPDIRGATTIREQLDKHRADASCAVCHQKMDPPGFALEAFDPIGGWRDVYRADAQTAPKQTVIVRPLTFDYVALRKEPGSARHGPMTATVGLGPAVDASGRLPDGRAFEDFNAFRRHILDRPDQIARALAGHLLTYATGAPPQYADRAPLAAIVRRTGEKNHGFRTLVHELIQSPLFLNQ